MAATPSALSAGATVSATGGSARSQAATLEQHAWAARPVLATVVRVTAILIPVLCGVAAVQVGARLSGRPSTDAGFIAWFIALGLLACVVMRVVELGSRRLLPLAMMLRLSLVFPDHGPSRFALALRRGTAKDLQRAVEDSATAERFAAPQASAEAVLQLLAHLNHHDRRTRGHCERVRADTPTSSGSNSASMRTAGTECTGPHSCTTSGSSTSDPRS